MKAGDMRVLVATDAWHPQVNGVVRTLTSLARSAAKLGVSVEFLTPDGFPSAPLPTYPDLRLALPTRREIAHRIDRAAPDAIHIATEGPIGHFVRAYCIRQRRPFTTSYTTRFPEYIAARAPIPERWSYAALRRFHAAAAVTMVSTPSLMAELGERRFRNLGMWTRGVDTDLFRPDRVAELDLPRPIFVSVGRVAVEKNLAAFLALDCRGARSSSAEAHRNRRSSGGFRKHTSWGSSRMGPWRPISPLPTCSSSPASRTPSASSSSRRWRAASRWRRFQSPARKT